MVYFLNNYLLDNLLPSVIVKQKVRLLSENPSLVCSPDRFFL